MVSIHSYNHQPLARHRAVRTAHVEAYDISCCMGLVFAELAGWIRLSCAVGLVLVQKKGADATPFADYIEVKGLLDIPRGARKAAASALRGAMSDFDWKWGPGHNLFPKGDGTVIRTSSLAAGSPSSRPHPNLWDADLIRGPDAVEHRPADASHRCKGREDKDKGGWDNQRNEGVSQERSSFRPGTAPGPVMGWKSDSPLSDRLRTASTSSTYEVLP